MTSATTPDTAPTPTRRPAPDAGALLAWYDRHRRDLPWRARPGETPDPYRVWLSEVMLQQTTVKAVIPYFHAFTRRWPTVGHLAAAPDEEVLAAWAGLGYYARARKLIACARAVAADHGGRFPAEEAVLLALPGIGPYTAAAIAAIAFDQRAVVVDGNVERVVTRLHRVETALPAAKPEIKGLTDALTPDARPGDFAQAMMDLGATICTPRNPACALCPFSGACRARAAGDPLRFPVKAAKAARPQRFGTSYLVRCGADVLLGRRPPRGLLGGMAEVPGSPWTGDPPAALAHAPITGLTWRPAPVPARHVFTHFELEVVVMVADAPTGTPAPQGMWWHPLRDLDRAGLPSVMRKIVEVGSSVSALRPGAVELRPAPNGG